MTILRVRLFGGLALAWDETPLPAIPGVTTRSLLAYLLTYRDRAHTRDLLAGTFWPSLPDAVARRRLSQTLWHIRRILPPQPILRSDHFWQSVYYLWLRCVVVGLAGIVL